MVINMKVKWKDEWHNGKGTITYPDEGKYEGELYEGEFKDNRYHGKGTLTSTDGAKYVGEFKDNRYHGKGEHTFPDGSKYVGEYKYLVVTMERENILFLMVRII